MATPSMPAPESDMNETLTPQEAARVLSKAQSWETALENRTAGITWMIWGIVSPGIFVTYAFASALAELEGIERGSWMGFLWMPWVAMGIVATAALWRTAALSVPKLGAAKEGRRILWTMLALGTGLSIALALAQPDSGTTPLGGLGAMWLLAGVLNVFRGGREARVVTMTVGTILLATALVMTLTAAPLEVSGTVSMIAAAVVPFGAGLWHVLRG